jgi:DNA polymerase I-like protein with 3'-5' exonuclease and polymerase domains
MPKYWKRQIELARIQGWVETQAGRRIQIGQEQTWDPNNKWSYESTAINFPIQGVGADQKYLAMMVLRDYLPRVDGRLYFELHDGIFCVVPDRYAEKAAREIRTLLSNLPYERAWGRSFPIQFPVDAKLGKTWGSLKEVKD